VTGGKEESMLMTTRSVAPESSFDATLDPLFGSAARPALVGGGLHSTGVTAFARWLLDPGVEVSEEMRAALIEEIDISVVGMAASVSNFLIINALDAWLTQAPVFYVGLGVNALCGAGRLIAGRLCERAPMAGRAAATDIYLFTTLVWCAMQGVFTGLAMASNNASLQVIGAAVVLAVQGALAARNYSAPRFVGLMLAALTVPFVIGTVSAHNHWLLVIAVLTPSYVFAYATTIRRFHRTAIASQLVLERSRYQARHDPLTGALNRFGLMSALQGEAAVQGDAPLSLFYLDLDGFKSVNDQHGHAAGDSLLRQVADRLRKASRGTDQVARLGGDEFAIVVPGIGPITAEVFAARIIQAVGHAPYVIGNELTVRVGVSVGFACGPEDSALLPELFTLADKALYMAKAKGKGVSHRDTV
jgi:diguanylate cyclase (GGDEF)-like protein